MLLNGGELGGQRVLEPLTVRRAIAEVGKPEFDRSLLVPLRYSAGMMLGDTPWGLFGRLRRRLKRRRVPPASDVS